jgi:hypothetical protein
MHAGSVSFQQSTGAGHGGAYYPYLFRCTAVQSTFGNSAVMLTKSHWRTPRLHITTISMFPDLSVSAINIQSSLIHLQA